MIGWKQAHHPALGERPNVEVRAGRCLQSDAKLGKPTLHCLNDAVEMLHVVIDMHVVAALGESLDHTRQEGIAERTGRENPKMSALGIAQIRQPLQQTICHGLQRLHVLIDGLAFRRRDQAVANPVEQRKSEVVFQMLDGVGDGRL